MKGHKHNPTPLMEINHISKMFGTHMRHAADEKGIPSGYRAPLFHLSHHPEGLTPIELAKKTHLTAPTISVTLQKMERDGYTRRVASDTDQRSFKVFLTDNNPYPCKSVSFFPLMNLSSTFLGFLT